MNLKTVDIYTDGGCIQCNPSPFGGTWAWTHVDGDRLVGSGSGILVCHNVAEPIQCESFSDSCEIDSITNNLMELWAVYQALLECHRIGATHLNLFSDSGITLGRLTKDWAWNGIPQWLKQAVEDAARSLHISATLMNGHPTRAELAAGIGKRGYPTSKWNVWCDGECQRLNKLWIKK